MSRLSLSPPTASGSRSTRLDPHPPPTKQGKFRLSEKLYDQVTQSGSLLDLILIVGDEKVYAHRCVATAASDVIKEKLVNQLVAKGIVELPSGTSVETAKAFVKVMYYEELDTGPNIKTVLDVISLCDKFLVKKLLDSCMDSVVSKITTDNCLEICERSFGMTRCERLLDTAFSCFMRNISKRLLEKCCTSLSYKMWSNILEYEGLDGVDIPESDLFVQILKWRAGHRSKENQFQKLVSLIRFPLMDAMTIVQVVNPTGLLNAQDCSDILCYILGGGENGSSIPKSVTHSRKSKFAKDGAELDLLLKSARAGDFIQLGRGEYKGNFQVPDKVTLKGVLPGTVISSTNRRDINQNRPRTNSKPLMVVGSDAKISDLQFECNFHQLGPRLGLQILGFRNTVTNIIFINCSFIPHGKHNIVKNVKHLT